MSTEKPKLRQDLKIIRQVTAGEVAFVLKDPFNQNYFRFQEGEYKILLACDGTLNLAGLLAKLNKLRKKDDALAKDELEGFIDGADKGHLFEKSGKEKNAMILARVKETRQSALTAKKGSILYKRVPAIDPQKYFTVIYPYIRFFWTPGFVILSLAMMAMSGAIIIANWEEVLNGVKNIITFQQDSAFAYFQLWLVVMVVIALHEHAHGLTCYHFGGEVHEMGFLFMFFQPCMYANVSDAWTFADRGKRLWVTAAGGYFEFWLGSIAAILWSVSNPDSAFGALMYQAMTVCGLSSVLVNFNPLLKYDGYYALCDLLETPNLKVNSFVYLKLLCKRHILRMDVEGDDIFVEREKRAFVIYGICSLIYMTGMLLGLWMLASGFLIDTLAWIGVAVALLLGYKLMGKYVVKLSKFLWEYVRTGPVLKTRRRRVVFASIAGALVLAMFIPVTHRVEGPVEVESAGHVFLRPKTGGYVESVLKRYGDRVAAGEVVAILRNDTLRRDYDSLRVSKQLAEARLLKLGDTGNPAVRRELLLDLDALTTKIGEKEKDLAGLTVCSPVAGVLVTPDLEARIGDYAAQGRDLCEVLEPETLRFSIVIEERDITDVEIDQPINIDLRSFPGETLEGKVGRVQPISRHRKNKQETTYRASLDIANPPVDGNVLGKFRAGMTGTAGIDVGRRALGSSLWAKFRKAFRSDFL